MTDRRPCDPPNPIEVVERAVDIGGQLVIYAARTVLDVLEAIVGRRPE